MTLRRYGAVLLLFVALGVLTACESSKEKAARHLQSALELIEEGDTERALVEFRNVFQLDPDNREARMALGALMEGRGNLPEALAQYQHVADRAPEDQEALQAGARLAAAMDKWPEASKLADMQLALDPGNPAMLSIKAAADYAYAVSTADAAARAKAAQTARTLLAAQPDVLLLHRVVIDNLIQDRDYAAAISATDAALAIFPDEKGFYLMRVSAWAAQNDNAAVEAELLKMVQRFPDDVSIGATLLRWYISQDQIDEAEAFLRQRAETGDLAAGLDLVNFQRQLRSIEAALAEIDAVMARMTEAQSTGEQSTETQEQASEPITPEFLLSLRASLLFEQGKQDEAVTVLQGVLTDAKASDRTRQIKVMLAQMLFSTGDVVQARALVEAVLAEEAGQLGALKLKAAWLIDDDKTDDAVALLRKALDANPRDAEGFTLLAKAYERAGNHDLVGDMLSQAVVASGKAPAESLRYATVLMADAKYLPAEALLVDALRLDTANVAILAKLGQLYVVMKDWPRATGVVDRLDELAVPEALEVSQSLRPAILAGTQKLDDAIGYLKGLTDGEDASLNAQIALIQAYLANGQPDKARLLAEDMLAKAPDSAETRFIVAAVKGAMGDTAGAVAGYRDLLAQDPTQGAVWAALVRQLAQDGKGAEAEAAVDEALQALPEMSDLLMMKAGFLEQRQDAEGAIAVYQTLYAKDTSNPILANNLASMLSAYRQDPDSLEKAYVIARRLRGTKVPAFADTYGWIALQRGNATEALPYLEAAATGLPEDPMVQFHLADAYRVVNRPDDARAQYAKVLALVPADDARDFVQTARKAVEQK